MHKVNPKKRKRSSLYKSTITCEIAQLLFERFGIPWAVPRAENPHNEEGRRAEQQHTCALRWCGEPSRKRTAREQQLTDGSIEIIHNYCKLDYTCGLVVLGLPGHEAGATEDCYWA
jgi:hypothetical protein